MPVLDGKHVAPEVIDPAKHRYLGNFRTPQPPTTKMADGNYAAVMVCGCWQHLWSMEAIHEHWLQGHFDVPQYVTIEDRL